MTFNITTYILGALAAMLGALGLYTRGQHYKIKNLNAEKEAAEEKAIIANRVARINQAKADLHKDVARTIVKDNTLTREKVKQVQEKIDEINNDEDFVISL